MNTTVIEKKPVLAAIDASAPGMAAMQLAAYEANARALPLRLFLTRPVAIFSNPIAMAPHSGGAAGNEIIDQAKKLVAELRTTYPTLDMSAVLATDAAAKLRRESGNASFLYEAAHHTRIGLLGRARRAKDARCPIIQTNAGPVRTDGDRVVVIADGNVPASTLALATDEAARRNLPVHVSQPGEQLTNAALVVTDAPARRSQANADLLSTADCPVLIAPR